MSYPHDLSTCPHAVYRAYDANKRLLYIGMSCDPDSRIDAHRYRASWAGEYDHHEVIWYDDRTTARAVETAAIKAEHPAHNEQHNQPPTPRTPTTRITLDLDPATYTALNQLLGMAAAEIGAPVSKAQALRAMIRAATRDAAISGVILDHLRGDSPSK